MIKQCCATCEHCTGFCRAYADPDGPLYSVCELDFGQRLDKEPCTWYRMMTALAVKEQKTDAIAYREENNPYCEYREEE